MSLTEVYSHPKKCLRTAENDDDLISNLPECLISNILSRLPTEYAVKTSVLSRNWKYKWTSIYDIDIDDNIQSFVGKNAVASFTDVVTRLLLRTQNSRLESFHLACNRACRAGHIETWVSDVLMRNVQYLAITANNIDGLISSWCFSGWTLLTVLQLDISCTLKVGSNCFPNLKRLCMGREGRIRVPEKFKIMTTIIPDNGPVVLSFPVLEILRLINCEWLDVKSVQIQAPELISAFISFPYEVASPEIEICGPKLATFDLWRARTEKIVLSAPAVTHMTICSLLLEAANEAGLHKILMKCPNLKVLKLIDDSLRVLLKLKPRLGFPTFDHLKELEVTRCHIKDLMESLDSFPVLESLFVNVFSLKDYEFGEAYAPKVSSHLKVVKILVYSGTKCQHGLAKYLLEHAENLHELSADLLKNSPNVEKMSVGAGKPVDRAEAVIQFLSKLKPKGSKCKLVVEQYQARPWFRPAPRVIMGKDGSRTRIVYGNRYSCDF